MDIPLALNPATDAGARRRRGAPRLRQQSITQAMLIMRIGGAAAQWALAASDGARARGEQREARAWLQAAKVAGEDGEFGRRGLFRPRQERGRVQDSAKPVRVRRAAKQHLGCEEPFPVQSEDRHGHQQDAQGTVSTCLFHCSPHKG
jgi:hypothetical protein